jgi:DNA replication protein DnaC
MDEKEQINDILAQMKLEKEDNDRLIQEAIKEEFKNHKVAFNDLNEDLKGIITMEKQPSGGEKKGTPAEPKLPKKEDLPKFDDGIEKDKNFYDVIDDLLVNNNVYLYGRAGTGKTVLAKDVANALCGKDGMYKKGDGDPYYILNCSQWTSPMQIIGGYSIQGYEKGQLEKAWTLGGVLIIDELPKLDPNTAGLLNDALAQAAEDEDKAFIVNGQNKKLKKHKDFMVIGTGNTDMKSVSVNFSGNNRQDYSLVDRFVGSMYKVDYNYALEYKLCYPAVLSIGEGLRAALPMDSIEAITLRSMLNFNRVYQNQMLKLLGSPAALWSYGVTQEEVDAAEPGIRMGKTLKDSVDSFIESLGVDRAKNLRKDAKFRSISTPGNMVNIDQILIEATKDKEGFARKYSLITKVNPKNNKKLTDAEWAALKKERDMKVEEIKKAHQ